MKRLYEVNGQFFENKEMAKNYRNLLACQHLFTTVKLGPDHHRYGTGQGTFKSNVNKGKRRQRLVK